VYSVIARKKAVVLLRGPWLPYISYPDDLMEYCGVNYDYGGVWARIPTPENLRIFGIMYGGGMRWHGTTPYAVHEIHSQRLPPPRIYIWTLLDVLWRQKKLLLPRKPPVSSFRLERGG